MISHLKSHLFNGPQNVSHNLNLTKSKRKIKKAHKNQPFKNQWFYVCKKKWIKRKLAVKIDFPTKNRLTSRINKNRWARMYFCYIIIMKPSWYLIMPSSRHIYTYVLRLFFYWFVIWMFFFFSFEALSFLFANFKFIGIDLCQKTMSRSLIAASFTHFRGVCG